jgi:hypothetical protein
MARPLFQLSDNVNSNKLMILGLSHQKRDVLWIAPHFETRIDFEVFYPKI